jgi:DNA-binding GntR family transcriptional regulator
MTVDRGVRPVPVPASKQARRTIAAQRDQASFATKGEAVQRLIRQAIASGQIQAGDRLLQNELAEGLGVSPTP